MRSKPRILQIGKYYPPYMGGIETHLQNLCHALAPDYDVSVLVASTGRRTSHDVVEGIPVTRVGTWGSFAAAPVSPGLVGEIRRADADLVHIHVPHPVAILAYLASRRRGPLVVTYHSDIVRAKARAVGTVYEPIQRRVFSRCDAIIATSPPYLATSPVLADYRDKCRVIPYGIPLDEFSRVDHDAVRRIRAEHGDRVVIAVGRLIYYKGFEYLIRAMKKVRGKLLIIGDGPLRGPLESEARALGIANQVTFLGEIQNTDIPPYYHASDVFALPSIARSEAFGIVQIEAMACGKPVVNTLLDSGVPFVSINGETGLSVPPRDADALAGALSTLLDDPDRRAALGRAARARAEREFDISIMGRRIRDLYTGILGPQKNAEKHG
jgi:glycosyltransferase involved in cell wall biosynthesis